MPVEESKIENEVQRIYVGGMAPPSLTVEMVQSRLIKTLSETIDIISFDASKPKTNLWGEDTQRFFFMTAKLKNTESGSQHMSALDAVAKLYNNVKWKGCTLKVEKARLHILDRLKEEREQLKYEREHCLIHRNEPNLQVLNENDENTESTQIKKLKRHLRIRRRFGEEAYVVDTKPIEAKDQKELHLSLKKQREKFSKHMDLLLLSKKRKKDDWARESLKQETNVALQSKVFLNRGVHIHFGESNMDQNYMTHTMLNKEVDLQPTVSDHNSDSTGSVSSSTDSDSNVDIDETKEEKDSGYAWSDEDSSEESASKIDRNRNDPHPSISNDEESISSEESNQSEDSRESDKGYIWSDSENENSDNEKNDAAMKQYDYSMTKHDDLDEFAAFFNDDVDDSSPITNTTYNEEIHMNQEEKIDLSEDVKSNLSVIAKLFPDLVTKTPVSFTSEGEKRQPQNSMGLDSFGIIQRYDPLADSASNHENVSEQVKSDLMKESYDNSGNELEEFQDDEKKEDNSSSSESSGSEESISNDGDENDDEQFSKQKNSTDDAIARSASELPHKSHDESQKDSKPKPVPMGQIYEQKKLENIFQQDRTSGGTTAFTMSSLFQTELQNNSASSIPQDGKTGFSFSFEPIKDNDHNDAISENASSSIVEETPVIDTNVPISLVESSVDPGNSAPKINLKKRRGMSFSEHEIDAYVHDFFNLNDGVELVAEHLQNMKSSSYLKSQDEWQEKRKSLTSDWKRKHKFAVAQRKKKFRYR